MKKFFLHECKNQLLPFLIFTAISVVLYLSILMGGTSNPSYYTGALAFCTTFLALLAILVPVYIYSFDKTRRGADFYYALPLRREQLYLVKTVVGLLLVLLPFTLAYWTGALFTIVRHPCLAFYDESGIAYSEISYFYYVPLYFSLILAAIPLYGLSAFVVSRTNSMFDSVWLIVGYTFLGFTIAFFLYTLGVSIDTIDWFTFSPLGNITTKFQRLLLGKSYELGAREMTSCVIYGILGFAGYAGMFATLRFRKAEDAGGLSNSWFAYRVTIPLYVGLAMVCAYRDMISIVLVLVCGFIGCFIYRRSFRLKLSDVLSVVGAGLLGLLISVFV